MTASLAYRKNEAEILRGIVPEKYTRLLPFIPGDRVLEIGSAEGVLALLLARAGKTVYAVERNAERHSAALELFVEWTGHFPHEMNSPPFFTRGDVVDHLHLLERVDTFVAVRVIYYLGDQLDRVFAEVAKNVPNVVLLRKRKPGKSMGDRHCR